MTTLLKEIDGDQKKQEQKMGWECPRCHNCISPASDVCPSCERKKLKENNIEDKEILMG